MLRLNIHSQKHGQMWIDFNSQEEINAFLLEKGNHYGELARQEIIPATQTILDEDGNILQEAKAEEIITHPATVEYVIEDITELTNQSNNVNKYLKRIQFGQLLMAELAALNKAKLDTGSYTSEQVLSLKRDLALVKDFVIEGSLGFALQTLQQAQNVPTDIKSYFVNKIQQHLNSED